VISRAHRRFWEQFNRLPKNIQVTARRRFSLWRREPFHPSLHFKRIGKGVWSVRINDDYRAMALRERDEIIWFWIGPHATYDRLLS
jgi:hypothetical protein